MNLKETNIGWSSIRGQNISIFLESQIQPPEKFKSFIIYAIEEIGITLNKSQVVNCHRLGKSEKTTVKVLNRKDAKNILLNKKKFKGIDISKIVTDDIEVRSDQSPEVATK